MSQTLLASVPGEPEAINQSPAPSRERDVLGVGSVQSRPRCLFVVEDHPLTANAPGGGPATMRHHLEMLLASPLETALLILRLSDESYGLDAFIRDSPAEWDSIQRRCAWTRVLTLDRAVGHAERSWRFARAVVDPLAYLTLRARSDSLAALAEAVAQFRPDVIWAENFGPAAWALHAAPDCPVVYSHHDWVWRVWTHASRTKTRRFRSHLVCQTMRRSEEALVRRAAGVVSSSATETTELTSLNRSSWYLPPVYPLVNLGACEPPGARPRVVHVGGMTTASNRLGLDRFLDVVWPVETPTATPPELWVVGSLTDAPEHLLQKLGRARAHCTGFVADLTTVLRPHDIHIVPWEHNTGTRMKLPLACNYAQAIVATRATAACLPELVDGENCLLADDLSSMRSSIARLCQDAELRARLGTAARHTFERCYTSGAVRARFEHLLESFIQTAERGRERS